MTGATTRLAVWLATGFGVGRIPVAPGTCGSGLALILHAVSAALATWSDFSDHNATMFSLPRELLVLQGAIILVMACVGVWAAGRAAEYFQQRDPKMIVIDEVSGQLFAWFGIAQGDWRLLIAGFALFRLFDIWKPFGIRRMEAYPRGWGIMADDWLAGVYAALVLLAVRAAGWL